jgi:hypothetical protein
MAYETQWHVEKRVIATRYYGEVTHEELTEAGAGVQDYIIASMHPVFFLVDVRDITKYPTNLKELLETMGKNTAYSKDLEWTLIVTDSRFINFIGSVVSNFFKIAVRSYKTMEEAEAFIIHHAPEIASELEARKGSQQSDATAS